ncbi:ABC transporter ATP-binding protein [Corynebacterium pseudotuberculosis]|uniref:ATP-binding cassette domain-containing protein n=1 Tax=Corynebacterium pseudotuberculosis 258 TaxID=1168865 RepID=A0AAU8PJ19_CORPS|nr:ABC transporter ATP-binding protein [Corynebacterium pseudotuberculosis]AER68387.1 ABC transporter ATP-binding protein [Corynebacterium pseudotuberculosis 1/06-A]AEQ05852.1 ATP-binding cassette domain-containing protein [Corynebacterium pseudotuberculosis CIP 52.97]AFB71627.1 ATP-binding cassette domain-containing protein [Corynebacterium pseudotuberculosis 316]AFH90127.1 ATP-binding cassette domain-containing protein [Corynebacterium pseudotuberculosis 31]AFK15936.1 ATP-binding cassette do
MITATDLNITFQGTPILQGVNLSAQGGHTIGIVGPNGSGKTTLLRALYKSLSPQSGRIEIDTEDLSSLTPRRIAQKVAVVAQERDSSLPLRVSDCVGLGRLAQSTLLSYSNAHNHMIVASALEQVGLSGFGSRLISELSGGERQRVLIARAIAQQADHVLLDEPTNHLDLAHQFAIMELVTTLRSTSVVVLHDLNLAARFCTEVIVLNHGMVVAQGKPDHVFNAEMFAEVFGLHAQILQHRGSPQFLFSPLSSRTS